MQSRARKIKSPSLRHVSGCHDLKTTVNVEPADRCIPCLEKGLSCHGGRKEDFGCIPCTEWLRNCNWSKNSDSGTRPGKQVERVGKSSSVNNSESDLRCPPYPIATPEASDVRSLTNAFLSNLSFQENATDVRTPTLPHLKLEKRLSEDWTFLDPLHKKIQAPTNRTQLQTSKEGGLSKNAQDQTSSQQREDTRVCQAIPWPVTPPRYEKNPFLNLDGTPRSSPKPPTATTSSSPTSLASSKITSFPTSSNPSAVSSSSSLNFFATSQTSVGRQGSNSIWTNKENRGWDRDRGDDDGEDDERRGERRSKRVKRDNDQRKLMCPFFKRHPTAPHNAACSHGFPSVHRIKEHLQRGHRGTQCLRCKVVFDNDEEHSQHQLSDVRCAEVNKPLLFITWNQERQLKDKREAFGKEWPEERKWAHMYKILFPKDSMPYPSPYWEDLVVEQVEAPYQIAQQRFENRYGRIPALDLFLPILREELRRTSVATAGTPSSPIGSEGGSQVRLSGEILSPAQSSRLFHSTNRANHDDPSMSIENHSGQQRHSNTTFGIGQQNISGQRLVTPASSSNDLTTAAATFDLSTRGFADTTPGWNESCFQTPTYVQGFPEYSQTPWGTSLMYPP